MIFLPHFFVTCLKSLALLYSQPEPRLVGFVIGSMQLNVGSDAAIPMNMKQLVASVQSARERARSARRRAAEAEAKAEKARIQARHAKLKLKLARRQSKHAKKAARKAERRADDFRKIATDAQKAAFKLKEKAARAVKKQTSKKGSATSPPVFPPRPAKSRSKASGTRSAIAGRRLPSARITRKPKAAIDSAAASLFVKQTGSNRPAESPSGSQPSTNP